jgi:tetratricopeptide (TPR) repeat protein
MTKTPPKTTQPKAKAPAARQDFTSKERALGAAEVAQKFRLINDLETSFENNFDAFVRGEASLAQLMGITRDQAYAFAEYAYTLYEQGRVREAKQIFEALVIQNPADPYMHFMLGVIYAKMDMPEEAVEAYGNSLERDPENIAAYTNRGEILLQHGEFDEALTDLQAAIKLDASGSNPFAMRARVLAQATAQVIKKVAGKKKQ